jgi:putative PIN family toxin of toxin-antitoxin system
MIRVVLDTNILFSAILKSSGPQAALIRLIVDRQIIPCVSPATLAEYHEVLARPILHRRAAEVEYLLDLLTRIALLVVPTTSINAATDPDDNCFLECAEAANADYLITGNKRHFPETWKKTKIVNTREFLDALEERDEM